MHDIKWIRENPEAFEKAMRRRKVTAGIAAQALALDEERRGALTRQQELQKERNELSQQIGMAKKKGENAEPLMERVKAIKEAIEAIERELGDEGKLSGLLATLPNILEDSVPEGPDETGNRQVREGGKKPAMKFTPREHDDVGVNLGLLDFKQAAQVSGARFVYLTGDLARMERALAQFMLDMHTQEFGFIEVVPPYLVRAGALYGTGQLPKFAEDLFRTTTDHWLIPTAEVSLANMVADKILDEGELPIRLTGYTPCFRSEAGSAGKDTKGMIRQHQFSKVELISITTPEQSGEEHERMASIAEEVLKRLGLAYRVMLLCSGDTGFASQKTYDLEVWLPGQNCYREISSVSNCGAFQARRMKARCRKAGDKETRFVHMLNGSALAVGRTMVAILENYQQEDGSVAIPAALQPYMGGRKVIEVQAAGFRRAG